MFIILFFIITYFVSVPCTQVTSLITISAIDTVLSVYPLYRFPCPAGAGTGMCVPCAAISYFLGATNIPGYFVGGACVTPFWVAENEIFPLIGNIVHYLPNAYLTCTLPYYAYDGNWYTASAGNLHYCSVGSSGQTATTVYQAIQLMTKYTDLKYYTQNINFIMNLYYSTGPSTYAVLTNTVAWTMVYILRHLHEIMPSVYGDIEIFQGDYYESSLAFPNNVNVYGHVGDTVRLFGIGHTIDTNEHFSNFEMNSNGAPGTIVTTRDFAVRFELMRFVGYGADDAYSGVANNIVINVCNCFSPTLIPYSSAVSYTYFYNVDLQLSRINVGGTSYTPPKSRSYIQISYNSGNANLVANGDASANSYTCYPIESFYTVYNTFNSITNQLPLIRNINGPSCSDFNCEMDNGVFNYEMIAYNNVRVSIYSNEYAINKLINGNTPTINKPTTYTGEVPITVVWRATQLGGSSVTRYLEVLSNSVTLTGVCLTVPLTSSACFDFAIYVVRLGTHNWHYVYGGNSVTGSAGFETGFGFNIIDSTDVNDFITLFAPIYGLPTTYQRIPYTVHLNELGMVGRLYDIALLLSTDYDCDLVCKGTCQECYTNKNFIDPSNAGVCYGITMFSDINAGSNTCKHAGMIISGDVYNTYLNATKSLTYWGTTGTTIALDTGAIIVYNGAETGFGNILDASYLEFNNIKFTYNRVSKLSANFMFTSTIPRIQTLIFSMCTIQGIGSSAYMFVNATVRDYQFADGIIQDIQGPVAPLTKSAISITVTGNTITNVGSATLTVANSGDTHINFYSNTINIGATSTSLKSTFGAWSFGTYPQVLNLGFGNIINAVDSEYYDPYYPIYGNGTLYSLYKLVKVDIGADVPTMNLQGSGMDFGLSYTGVLQWPCNIDTVKMLRDRYTNLDGNIAVVVCDETFSTQIMCTRTICSDVFNRPPPPFCWLYPTYDTNDVDYGYKYFTTYQDASTFCRRAPDADGYILINVKPGVYNETDIIFLSSAGNLKFVGDPGPQPVLNTDTMRVSTKKFIFENIEVYNINQSNPMFTFELIPSSFILKDCTLHTNLSYVMNIVMSPNTTVDVRNTVHYDCSPICYAVSGNVPVKSYQSTSVIFMNNGFKNAYGGWFYLAYLKDHILKDNYCISKCGMMIERDVNIGSALIFILGNIYISNATYDIEGNMATYSDTGTQIYGSPFAEGGMFSGIIMKKIHSSVQVSILKNNLIQGYPVAIRFDTTDAAVIEKFIVMPPIINDDRRDMRGVWNLNPITTLSIFHDILRGTFNDDKFTYDEENYCDNGCLPTELKCYVDPAYTIIDYGYGSTRFTNVQGAHDGCILPNIVISVINNNPETVIVTKSITLEGVFNGALYLNNPPFMRFNDLTINHNSPFLVTISGTTPNISFSNVDMYGIPGIQPIYVVTTGLITIENLKLYNYENNGAEFKYNLCITNNTVKINGFENTYARGFALKITNMYYWNIQNFVADNCGCTDQEYGCFYFDTCNLSGNKAYSSSVIGYDTGATIDAGFFCAAHVFNVTNVPGISIGTKLPVSGLVGSGYEVCYEVIGKPTGPGIIDSKSYIQPFSKLNLQCKGTLWDVVTVVSPDQVALIRSQPYSVDAVPLYCTGGCPTRFNPLWFLLLVLPCLVAFCFLCGCFDLCFGGFRRRMHVD